jgi:hypothetical protein
MVLPGSVGHCDVNATLIPRRISKGAEDPAHRLLRPLEIVADDRSIQRAHERVAQDEDRPVPG